MKAPALLLIFSFACHVSFSQTADSVQQIDICSNIKDIQSTSLPLNTNMKYSNVRLSVASLKAINKAVLLSLSEGDCVSGQVDDEIFQSDFDTLNNETYSIVRILPAKSINNQTVKFILYTGLTRSYLITFNRNSKRNNCLEAKSAVLLGFAVGNRHWQHNREAYFINDNKIKIEGDCWHENDEPGTLQELSVMLTIQNDGTIVMKEMPVSKRK